MASPYIKDKTGQRFGLLTVLYLVKGPHPERVYWRCLCECGNQTTVFTGNLREIGTKSCGCLKKGISHGLIHHPLYSVWSAMRQRCFDKNHPSYKNHGARGITVCERWDDFSKFIEDMGKRPSGTTLDRIDNNGDYKPGNCRWATHTEQSINRRVSRILEAFGKRKTLAEWAKEAKISSFAISSRIKRGMPVEQAIATPSASTRQWKPKKYPRYGH